MNARIDSTDSGDTGARAAPVNGQTAGQPAGLVREEIYERLRRDILSCTLRPGSQIREQALAEHHAVSKSPVRDALLRLQEQGLVEVLPRKGYRVKPVSLADAREMYEMRLLFERACITRAIDEATDEVLRALDRFRSAGDAQDRAAWIAYNREFHLALAEASGNTRLARAAREVIEQFDRLTYMSVAGYDKATWLQELADEHCAIIDAMQRRDKRQATALALAHVERSRERLLESLSDLAVVP
jgi:DNA-binding GntR family transcriptional regulator